MTMELSDGSFKFISVIFTEFFNKRGMDSDQ